jgi:hypothetical protein
LSIISSNDLWVKQAAKYSKKKGNQQGWKLYEIRIKKYCFGVNLWNIHKAVHHSNDGAGCVRIYPTK